MKKILILASLSGILLASCKTSQLGYNSDDVYASPSEEKKKVELARAEQQKQEEAERQRVEDERAAQKAMDDANPYYKDPSYNADDYYDYEYAARLNRFSNPIGVGYYDSYYTNMYTYNQNPMMYGTSIYAGYGCGMPSNYFSNVSFGISSGWGYGYNGYNTGLYYSSFNNPYGYNSFGYNYSPWYNDPWMYGGYYGYSPYSSFGFGYGNMAYMNGYYNGYYNGLYNSYYNIYDVNSNYQATNAPRNNRTTESFQGSGNNRQSYVDPGQQQNGTQRFSTAPRAASRMSGDQNSMMNMGGGNDTRVPNGGYRNREEQNRAGYQNQNGSQGQSNDRNGGRVRMGTNNNQSEQNNSQNRSWENNSGGSRSNSGGGGGGGGSSPRGGSGGGGRHR